MSEFTAQSVQYVLYSHYGMLEKEDFEACRNHVPLEKLPGVERLSRHLRGLRELLTTPGYEGMLVLFCYAKGLRDFLDGLESASLHHDLPDNHGLLFASKVAECLTSQLAENGLADRVRIITPVDLAVIFGHADAQLVKKYKMYCIGQTDGIRYDTPKIIEAIIRLRLIGSGVPAFRLDSDVLFRFDRDQEVQENLGLFKAVACALRAYRLRVADHTVATFLFSASYNTRDLSANLHGKDRFRVWSRAFATRVHPALIADPGEVNAIVARRSGSHRKAWERYGRKNLDEALARRFFGLGEDYGPPDPDDPQGITAIGAHPYFGVISGALLCLSEGAILDLPPFSNFRNNVMWIDDHLKHSLHRALKHFTRGETLDLEPGLSHARLDEVVVIKERSAVSDLPAYVFGSYLPTVLWGCIMDSWITIDPVLKFRSSGMKHWRKKWSSAHSKEQQAPLPKAILGALQRGEFGADMQEGLHRELTGHAIQRIEQVRQAWMKLSGEDGRKTFACYWAEGSVKEHFDEKCFTTCKNHLWQGIAVDRDPSEPIASLEDLTAIMAVKVTELIDDAVTYVKWVLDWPKFIQIVRSVPQGSFCGDMSWRSQGDVGR